MTTAKKIKISKTSQLLTRDAFREAVFTRDEQLCVMCKSVAVDAHHIMERRLWSDGGYYVENGASLCSNHHLMAESTSIPTDLIREKAGITKILLPPHLYEDETYDKWGNIILPNGKRLRGELFFDPSVQIALTRGDMLRFFTTYVKHPRTYHLPWSLGTTKDDKILQDTSYFEGKEVVVTVKYDGEQTTMYNDHIHARSIDSQSHPTQDYVRGLHGRIKRDIPEGWRVCGENLFAKHSIHYKNLRTYFMVHSIWSALNICLSWDNTLFWAELFGLDVVPLLYKGVWDTAVIASLYKETYAEEDCEGYVVRLASEFPYKDFPKAVGKYVREGHVTSASHWKHNRIVKNLLKG